MAIGNKYQLTDKRERVRPGALELTRSCSREHPWDGWCSRSQAETLGLTSDHHLLRTIIWLALLTATTIFLTSLSSYGQSPLPTDIDRYHHKHKKAVVLDEEAQMLAENYLMILGDLKQLAEDYEIYFAKTNLDDADWYRKILQLVGKRATDGSYAVDIDLLMKDIGDLEVQIEMQQAKLAAATARQKAMAEHDRAVDHYRNRLKIQKLSRNLRDELEIVVEMWEDEFKEYEEATEQIQLFFMDSLQLSIGDQIQYSILSSGSGKQSLVCIGDSQITMSHVVLSMEPPEVPRESEIAVVVAPTAPVVCTSVPSSSRSEEARAIRSFTDSTKVGNRIKTVKVTVPIGDMSVRGWDRPYCRVNSSVEVAAPSKREAKALSEQIELDLISDGKVLRVEIDIPTSVSHLGRIVGFQMEVMTPANHRFEAVSSFGEVLVRDMEAPVKVTGNNTRIVLSDLSDSVIIYNKIGKVTVREVNGPLDIVNTLGTIELTDCVADMNLENQLSSIQVTDCDGAINIKNSGPIRVFDHSGDISIINSNGLIQVYELQGALTAQNSSQPLLIEDITGAVQLTNVRAPISARRVEGRLTATNSSGSISAIGQQGPVYLTSTDGKVVVSWDEYLDGDSRIESHSGVVKLLLKEDLDLMISATAPGGRIVNSFSSIAMSKSSDQPVEFSLGRGSNHLEIHGTNSDIFIDKSE